MHGGTSTRGARPLDVSAVSMVLGDVASSWWCRWTPVVLRVCPRMWSVCPRHRSTSVRRVNIISSVPLAFSLLLLCSNRHFSSSDNRSDLSPAVYSFLSLVKPATVRQRQTLLPLSVSCDSLRPPPPPPPLLLLAVERNRGLCKNLREGRRTLLRPHVALPFCRNRSSSSKCGNGRYHCHSVARASSLCCRRHHCHHHRHQYNDERDNGDRCKSSHRRFVVVDGARCSVAGVLLCCGVYHAPARTPQEWVRQAESERLRVLPWIECQGLSAF